MKKEEEEKKKNGDKKDPTNPDNDVTMKDETKTPPKSEEAQRAMEVE